MAESPVHSTDDASRLALLLLGSPTARPAPFGVPRDSGAWPVSAHQGAIQVPPPRPWPWAGAQWGRGVGRNHAPARRPIPARGSMRRDVPLPAACPSCGGAVHLARVTSRFQEDLPVVRPIVRRFDVPVGCCVACGCRVQGRHPLQTSDALGAVNVHRGPRAVTLIVHLKETEWRYTTIATPTRTDVCYSTYARTRSARHDPPEFSETTETCDTRGHPGLSL